MTLDRDEFRRLSIIELDAVYRLALHLAPRHDQADDFVQETYLRAFKSAADFTLTEHGVRPYLFKILHNVVHTRTGQAQRQPAQLSETSPEPADAHAAADERCSDLSGLNWDVVDGRLKQAIEALPIAHRTVFLLCAVEGLRYREIADIVGVPIGTVMSRLHRARHVLSEQLADLATEQRLGDAGNRRDNELTSAS